MASVNGTGVTKERERTISFFEIVKVVAGDQQERMGQADWQQVLRALGEAPLGARIFETDKILIGDVLPTDGQRALKLMRVRDQHAWLEVYDSSADSIDALELGDQAQLLETSIVVFLPFGNVIGIIRGSNSAPTVSSLAAWLNGLKVFDDVQVTTRAMIAHEAQRELRQADEVSLITVRAFTNQAEALERRGSKLSEVFKNVRADYGDLEVTVTLKAGRRDNRQGRKALQEEARKILPEDDDLNIDAKARLVYIEADDRSRSRMVNFVNQHITAKRKIPTTSDDGSPIRNESAVLAILTVAGEHESDLRAIVDVK